MEISCPACRTRVDPEIEDHCGHCGCAIGILSDILWASRDSLQLCLEALRNHQIRDALDYAYEAWGLKNSPETAAAGLIAAVCTNDGVEVTRWLNRRKKMRAA